MMIRKAIMSGIISVVSVLFSFLAVSCSTTEEEESIRVEDISIEPQSVRLTPGETCALEAVIVPENATNKNVLWSSSDENVATVDPDGVLTAAGEGRTVVKAISEDGRKTAICEVEVYIVEVPVESVSVEPESLTLEVGEQFTLEATVLPEDATDRSVVWISSNPDVATVSSDGVLTANRRGSLVVTARSRDGKVSDDCQVTVIISVTGVSLEPDELSLKIGTEYGLVAKVIPSDASNRTLIWTSEDETVAKVSDEGKVSAVGLGTTVVEVKTEDGGFTAQCEVTVTEDNSFSGETVLIQAGTFMMGSPETEESRLDDETQHQVTLTKDFRMSIYEITNSQFCVFLNSTGVPESGIGTVTYVDNGSEVTEEKTLVLDSSKDAGVGGLYDHGVNYNSMTGMWEPVSGYEDHPVIFVSWFGATAYAAWVGGALPTEAQWEYACRAGSDAPYHFGSVISSVNDYGWIYTSGMPTTHEVGQKKPNAYGLYDMIGNVSEYCSDWFGEYPSEPVVDPEGPLKGTERCVRGSSIFDNVLFCRSAFRNSYEPDKTGAGGWVGFRVVFNED